MESMLAKINYRVTITRKLLDFKFSGYTKRTNDEEQVLFQQYHYSYQCPFT